MKTMIQQRAFVSIIVPLYVLLLQQASAQATEATTHQSHATGFVDYIELPTFTLLHGTPALPEGVTLDELLDYARDPPPATWPKPVFDNAVYAFTMVEQLEYRVANAGRDEVGWDAQGWIGNDNHKFWWKSEGNAVFEGAEEGDADLQALFATPLSAFWYLQMGLRYEQAWEPGSTNERFSLVLGVQGLAPYKFDVEPTLFLTDDGDLIAQLTASYDLYLTQRLVLQPRIEISASARDIPSAGLGSGIHGADFDLRLRYEIQREIAPYVGVRYSRLFGETASIATRGGSDDHDIFLVVGVRLAF